MLAPFGVFGVIMFLQTQDSGAILIGGAFIAALGAIWLWISFHRIDLTDEKITLGRFGILKRSLNRDEIENWYTWIGLRDDRGRTGPFIRLVIEPKRSSGKKPLVLPLKLFAPEDMQSVKSFLSKSNKAKESVDRGLGR